jgi:hypothetical protein
MTRERYALAEQQYQRAVQQRQFARHHYREAREMRLDALRTSWRVRHVIFDRFGPVRCIDTGAVHELPLSESSPREARQFVALLAEKHGFDAEAASLVTSELATNAVRHAKTPFAVTVSQVDGCARIAVTDGSTDAPIVGPDGHWGLRLIAGVAVDWGWFPTAAGKTVWADVPNPKNA